MTITRRHHPLLGQRLEVLRGGPRKLVLRTTLGPVMHVPRGWTDADGVTAREPPRDVVFTVESIRELVALVDAVQRRCT
ncbi:MAG: hypothetical protein IT379_23035 [Deltaproteobacteria bacterium]|nr:hypothetical protein [Deltaproteobacteria bacterium]